MVKEVASKTNDVAGDGTTTATVLAQAIVAEGMKYVTAGMNPTDLKRGIDKAVAALVEELKTSPNLAILPKKSPKSARFRQPDEQVGAIIAEAMEKVGKEGVITVEDGKSLENELDVVEGMQFDRGYPSLTSSTTRKTNRCTDNPFVFAVRQKKSATSATCCLFWNKWQSQPSAVDYC